MSAVNRHAPIGVFDSGIGGLSILRALRAQLPHEDFVYFADTAHNPYGDKSDAFVMARSLAIAHELVHEHRIKALVVACNTATAAAIVQLRQAYPDLPIVGVEPALKPAAQISQTGCVAVLATRGTLESAKFAALRNSLPQTAFACVPCDGLADRIERLSQGEKLDEALYATDLIAVCADYIRTTGQFGLKNGRVDTLVLGCTHYPLIRELFRSLAGEGVTIVDNAEPVALRTMQLLGELSAQSEQQGSMIWLSSGDAAQLTQAARYWGIPGA